MKAIHRGYAQPHQMESSDSRVVAFSFGMSLFLHLFILGTLVFMPQPASRSRFSSGVINVSLVALPGQAPAANTASAPLAAPQEEPKEPPKASVSEIAPPPQKTAVVPQKPRQTVSLAPKPKEKTSLKKETFDRTKIIDSAIKQVQKKVDDDDSASVKAALDRLAKKVQETETAKSSPSALGKTPPGAAGAGAAGETGAGGGARTIEAIRIYQAEIQYQIQKNWAFSPQLAGDNLMLEAVLAIKIMRNGEIEEIWFDKQSGNAHLDESAHRAIEKSNPLPALPREYIGSFYKIGLIFGPKGLK